LILALAFTSIVSATYPFTANCTCDEFCDYKCAPDSQPASNVTVYRMTMLHVLELENKDTGDVAGDVSFVLSRRTTAFECLKDPDSFMCKDVA